MEHFWEASDRNAHFGAEKKEYPFSHVHGFGIWILVVIAWRIQSLRYTRAVLDSFLYTRYLCIVVVEYIHDIIDPGHGARCMRVGLAIFGS